MWTLVFNGIVYFKLERVDEVLFHDHPFFDFVRSCYFDRGTHRLALVKIRLR